MRSGASTASKEGLGSGGTRRRGAALLALQPERPSQTPAPATATFPGGEMGPSGVRGRTLTELPHVQYSLMAVMSSNISVKPDDMPALCRAYGEASESAQRAYLRAQKALLWIFVGGGIASGLGQIAPLLLAKEQVHTIEVAAAYVGALLFGIGLWMSARQEQQAMPESWYDARALAESAKSMAWKYMMGADPYLGDDSDTVFTSDLRKLLNDARKTVSPAGADGPQITEVMRAVRALPASQRIAVYKTDRIADQCRWYTKKSAQHGKANRRWQHVVTWALVIAFALSILSILTTPVGAVAGIAASIAPAAIAWNQTRRHRELAHSYAFTSHEIGLLEAGASPVHDQDVSRFVADCETAFSREHTMWRARREDPKT